MENKINIAELLKDCPKDMELDCTSYDNVSFDKISEDKKAIYPIFCYITDKEGNRSGISFTENGCESKRYGAKCVIFPKGKNTWEGFHRPFVEGDIVSTESGMYIGIVKSTEDSHHCDVFCSINDEGDFFIDKNLLFSRFATEEEKQKLFDAIKAKGYKWNAETKTLERLIKPIFKKGDKVRVKKGFPEPRIACVIEDVCDTFYTLVSVGKIDFTDQDNWELVPDKFDISKLKPFDEVLVRDFDSEVWEIDFFSKLFDGKHFKCHGSSYVQCIPYKGNEYLHNTTNACNPFYKTWE